MALDVRDPIDHAGDAGDAGSTAAEQKISHQVFADPVQFLKVLKADFNQISANDIYITQNDLIRYEEYGRDPQGRRAAQVALTHFDHLQYLTAASDSHTAKSNAAISSVGLDHVINSASGNVSGRSFATEVGHLGKAALGATVTVVLTGMAVETGALPVFLPLAAGAAGVTLYEVKEAMASSSETNHRAEYERDMLATWPEINGHKPGR